MPKKEIEFVFCYWDEFNLEKDDSSSLQKKQDSEEDVHESIRERTDTGSNNKHERKKTDDS